MSERQDKIELLRQNGYIYHFTRMIYFNKITKKIFSYEYVDDNDITKLKACINEKNIEEYQFYHSYPMKDEIKLSVLDELKL